MNIIVTWLYGHRLTHPWLCSGVVQACYWSPTARHEGFVYRCNGCSRSWWPR